MPTWDEYKAYVKNNNPEIGVDIEDAERMSAIKYIERFYNSLEGALADMGKPEQIDFKEVMDEVFGDG